MTESEVKKYPELFNIVEEYVRPQRMASSGSEKHQWWQHAHRAESLYNAIQGLPRILVLVQYSQTFAFTFIRTGGVINSKIIGFATDRDSYFAVLQSRIHEVWARFFSGTLKDDLQYTPSDCLVTYPFPEDMSSCSRLEQVGTEYHEFRAALMVRNNEGLTKTYNRFHDPNEPSADIARLRELHAAMDRAVLDAYGWTDLQPTCEFLLDYEEEEDEDSGGRSRKKPWRYRWPDDFRDEVLSRLLDLNKRRAEQEALAGAADKPKKVGRKRGKRQPPDAPGLF
jgi:hypothetical protein